MTSTERPGEGRELTLQQAYQAGRALTRENQWGTRDYDLSCLFEACFGVQRYALPLRGENRAQPEAAARFFALIRQYAQGEPLQYLLGEWEFYGLPFYVGPGVLIPRPDTESLVEAGLQLIKGLRGPRVADLCAGSGCVGVALASQRPDATVWALELSRQAFGYLQRNVQRNRVGVQALQGDVLNPPEALEQLDLILCNPPYITGAEMAQLQPQVQREPELALYGGEDGLRFYQALPGLYRSRLKPGGGLLFEVGYRQAGAVADILKANGFNQVFTQRDLAGVERVVGGVRP